MIDEALVELENARGFCAEFFNHYNHVHRHGGIGPHTAASVHYGTADEIRTHRSEVLDAAYAANPGRFGHRLTRGARRWWRA